MTKLPARAPGSASSEAARCGDVEGGGIRLADRLAQERGVARGLR